MVGERLIVKGYESTCPPRRYLLRKWMRNAVHPSLWLVSTLNAFNSSQRTYRCPISSTPPPFPPAQKAIRLLPNSDSTPDKCTDPIWFLGVHHSGFDWNLIGLIPPKLPHRRSYVAVPSTQGRQPLLHLDVFDGYSCSFQHQHAPPKWHSKCCRAYSPPKIYTDFASSVDHISLSLLLHTTLFAHRPRTRTGRCRCSRRPNAQLL